MTASAPSRRVADVLVAPNCLRGYATAAVVAEAIGQGVRRAWPTATVALQPLADGGDGTLDVLADSIGGALHRAVAADMTGHRREVRWIMLEDGVGIVESAAICGIGDSPPRRLRPLDATSAGVGDVINAMVDAGVTTLLLGLGGTAVVDGGAGALHALGARFTDAEGHEVYPTPRTLTQIASIDLTPARRALASTRVELLSDVSVPLQANVATFGAQKGVTDRERPLIESALERFVDLLAAAGAPAAPARWREEWYGAGGGIGVGISAVAATTAASGADRVAGLTGIGDTLERVPLVITSEGAVDDTTWLGKLPGAIARRRRQVGLPTAVIAVRSNGDPPASLVSVHHVTEPPPCPQTSVTGHALRTGLARAAGQACARWRSAP
jgi:glycerate kinase